jgi:excinuclease ABC subunit A
MEEIIIKGARENNLKNINLSIHKNKLIAVTGLSGSGKSSLAYDTLQKECMRQYMESLGMVTDFLSKPKVDEIVGLSPSISVDQRLLNHNPRSTVGTLTEVYTYLRVLYARIGERRCPYCGMMFKPMGDAADSQADLSFDDEASGRTILSSVLTARRPTPDYHGHFSFNKPEGACPTCTGLGDVYEANLKLLVDESKSIQDGGILSWDWHWIKYYRDVFAAAEKLYGISLDFTVPIEQFDQRAKDYIYFGLRALGSSAIFPISRLPGMPLTAGLKDWPQTPEKTCPKG